VRVVEAELPALSVAVPLKGSLAPAVVILIDAGQLAVPESASLQVNETTAGIVTTPFTAAGVTLAVMPGLVLSIFSVTATEARLPFASVAVAVTTWFAPSVITICEPGHCTGGTPPEQA
jgi:hypothetical protein